VSATEVAYVTAGRLIDRFERHCRRAGLPFTREPGVRSWDETTLFCPAGMQQFKPLFADETVRATRANVQPCLRLTDLDTVGDGTHLLRFDMLGLFSLRDWSVERAVDFWMEWMAEVGVRPDWATVPPERADAWESIHRRHGLDVRVDADCVWSDGEIGGFCTEFFRDGVEIGNIVNPLGICIDAGFGLERILLLLGEPPPPRLRLIEEAVVAVLETGTKPGATGRGYVLRRLLRLLAKAGSTLDRPELEAERRRQARLHERYARLAGRHPDKPRHWWIETHGIDPLELD
jgi:alanyl-tRNA synthetase